MRVVYQGELREVTEHEFIYISTSGKEKCCPYGCSNIQELKDYIDSDLEASLDKGETFTIWKEKVLC